MYNFFSSGDNVIVEWLCPIETVGPITLLHHIILIVPSPSVRFWKLSLQKLHILEP